MAGPIKVDEAAPAYEELFNNHPTSQQSSSAVRPHLFPSPKRPQKAFKFKLRTHLNRVFSSTPPYLKSISTMTMAITAATKSPIHSNPPTALIQKNRMLTVKYAIGGSRNGKSGRPLSNVARWLRGYLSWRSCAQCFWEL